MGQNEPNEANESNVPETLCDDSIARTLVARTAKKKKKINSKQQIYTHEWAKMHEIACASATTYDPKSVRAKSQKVCGMRRSRENGKKNHTMKMK